MGGAAPEHGDDRPASGGDPRRRNGRHAARDGVELRGPRNLLWT